jgi:RHS repeat-associated protein
VTTDFLYDGSSVVQELSSGSVQANLLLGLGIDEVLQRTETTSTRNLLSDGLGSTLALTDNAGTVQTEYTYEPFGNTVTSGAASANPSQYTGRENDGTGLYYYRARYYHPGLQRFISEDPSRFRAGDVNLYAYVLNDPFNLVDPSGRQFVQALGACFGNPTCVALLGGGAYTLGQVLNHLVKPSNPWPKAEPGSSSTTYDDNGNPIQHREYGPDGYPIRDYDYDHDHGQGRPHRHDWGRPEDGGPPRNEDRQKGQPVRPEEDPLNKQEDLDNDIMNPEPDPDNGGKPDNNRDNYG